MDHMYPVFYNEVTTEIASYDTFKTYFDSTGWPLDFTSPAIDEALVKTNPPNALLTVYPTINQWNRLYRTHVPELKLWENATINSPHQDSSGNWIQDYSISAKSPEEMRDINIYVADIAKWMRESRVENDQISHGAFHFNASEGTRTAINDLIGYLTSDGEDIEIDWKGTSHPTTLLPRWERAKIEDLQYMLILVNQYQQKAFSAEKLTLDQQLIESFDTVEDVEVYYSLTYDTLWGS